VNTQERVTVEALTKAIEEYRVVAIGHGYENEELASGQCTDASDEFLHKLAEHGIEGQIEYYDPAILLDAHEYPYTMVGCHCHFAVRVGDFVIDWTARQFSKASPFPAVWRAERRPWRNCEEEE
jgi:hypothetical protein